MIANNGLAFAAVVATGVSFTQQSSLYLANWVAALACTGAVLFIGEDLTDTGIGPNGGTVHGSDATASNW